MFKPTHPMRILLFSLMLLALCLSAPFPFGVPTGVGVSEAAPTECDATLFLAAQLTAFNDPTPPVLDWHEMYWSFADGQYETSFSFTNGIEGFRRTVQVRHNKKLVGMATNGQWSVCAKRNDWKQYLLSHLPT